MGLKQQRGFVAGFDPGFFRQLAQLLDCFCLGGLEAFPFCVRVFHFIPGNGVLCPLEEIQGTDCHAG